MAELKLLKTMVGARISRIIRVKVLDVCVGFWTRLSSGSLGFQPNYCESFLTTLVIFGLIASYVLYSDLDGFRVEIKGKYQMKAIHKHVTDTPTQL